jgi:hypothetical protein
LRPKTKESLTSLAAVTPKKKETLHIKNQKKSRSSAAAAAAAAAAV